jgi:predicted ATP-grasp superfamily ATP-dependent carboligase
MNVLILDGNQNQAVASVRSVARAGYTAWAGEASPWSKSGWSRSSSGTFRYPHPRVNVAAFLESIIGFVRQRPGTLVLPMTEATTLPISGDRDRLRDAGAKLALPDHKDLLRAFDKNETTRLAASLGIAVPQTVVVATREQAIAAAASVRYPVVVKPRASEEVSEGKVRTAGRPMYARNAREFESGYQEVSRHSSAALVQEFVSGEGTGYFALMNHGELRAEFAHRRIRDVRPTGSGSALRMSVEPDPEIRRSSLAMLAALRWHGVAMVEYRKDAGAPPVFMEVNGRFWHSLPLACYAGVDFPALLARMTENGDVAPCLEYRRGVRCRWLQGDLRHLLEVWKGPPPGYPARFPGRLRTLYDFLTPVPGTYHDLFQWKDPLPELGDWLFLLSRVLGDR